MFEAIVHAKNPARLVSEPGEDLCFVLLVDTV
jgi:hypothetical protein